jgi:hypothetical protein
MEEIFSKIFESYTIVDHYDYTDIPDNDEDVFGDLRVNKCYGSLPNHSVWKEKSRTYCKEDFDKNTKNIFARLRYKRFSVFVVKNDKKVTLKYFTYNLSKQPGEQFFRKTTRCDYVSYNINKNLVYQGSITNYHKKKKFSKKIRCADFTDDFLSRTLISIDINSKEIFELTPIKSVNLSTGKDAITAFLKHIPGISYSVISNSTLCLHKTVMEKKGIKLSDNWWVFSNKYPQPKAKDFKKFGIKYLDAVMGINGYNGDKIKRVLHTVNNFNPQAFNNAVNFFGKDFILSQPDIILKRIFESNLYEDGMKFEDITSKKERLNIFEIFMLVVNGEIHQSTYSDHMNFLRRLRKFDNIKWLSNTYDDFKEEHLNWTELVDFYTKGTFKRIYSGDFINFISQPIVDGDNVVTPTILTDSNEYNTESFVQSNCVKGYIQRPESMIISLRRGEKERATIEYRIIKTDKIKLNRVQTLGRFNNPLDPSWENSIDILDGRIKQSLKMELFTPPSIRCKIGYSEFESGSHFDDKKSKTVPVIFDNRTNKLIEAQFLIWDDSRVENYNNVTINILGEQL